MWDLQFTLKLVFACAFLVDLNCNWKCAAAIKIECIPLKKCATALKVLQTAKYAPETIDFIKISHCGFDKNNEPKVWCTKLDFCVTPQNKNGTCTLMNKCKPYLQLKSTLDTSDPQVIYFLNKFRCNEILREEYVCCQDEPVHNNNYEDSTDFRITGQPMNKFAYEDYDYDVPFGFHDYHLPHSKGSPNNQEFGSEIRNRWNIHTPEGNHKRFVPDYYDVDPHSFHDFDYPSNKDFHEISTNNRHGTNRDDEGTQKSYTDFDYPLYKTYTTEESIFQPTRMNRNRGESHNSDEEVNKETTHGNRNTETSNDSNHRTISTTSSRKKWNTNDQESTSTKPTTPITRITQTTKRSTTTSRSTTSRRRASNSRTENEGRNEGGNEGGIIFEDEFRDTVEGKSKRKTEETTKPNRDRAGENRESCQAPDGKRGKCTQPNNCQHYKNLQLNLDKSKQSTRDYLSRFKCDSNGEICCPDEEEKSIDNSLFSGENAPDPISKICGRQTASNDRIVGGSVANLGEFPWLALLQYPGNRGIQMGCGGSLINARYVVTAAHCVDPEILRRKRLGQLRQVVLGEFDTRNKTDCIYMKSGNDCADPPKIYRVESIIPHKMYTSNNTRHDIALIRLDQDVTFTDYIKPICLPSKTTIIRGNETFVIAGWGRTGTEMTSPVLRKAKIPTADRQICNRRRELIEGQICAGSGNGTDSCSGDSGGPLMLEIASNFEFVTQLMGIISYGFTSCGSGPSVHTYVPFYIDWINENMKA